MQLTMENTGDANRIYRYSRGEIVINGESHASTTVVTRDQLLPDWGPAEVAALSPEHADALLALGPELIVIGTGSRQQFPAKAFMIRTIEAGIGMEAMTTPAACRTYNVLIAEQRNVLALLFMIEE